MDVTSVIPGFPSVRSSAIEDRLFAVNAGTASGPKAETERFDYDKVMMDLDEVRNFLYMLIGAEIQVKQDERIGVNVDRVA
ncbi:MAG: hypothetical protein KBA15_05710 [Spirochaetes bacterium]|jgi:hypothetical protein|nr:hypothetical protein [Spirochaetota bacterium]